MNITLGFYPLQRSVNMHSNSTWAPLKDTQKTFIQQNIYHMQCCYTVCAPWYTCAVRKMSALTFEKPWLLLLHVPDTFYVIKWILQRSGVAELWPPKNGKGVLWYLFQRTFQFQSHSQHLWLQSSTSNIMNLEYFIGSQCIQSHSASVAGCDGTERSNV